MIFDKDKLKIDLFGSLGLIGAIGSDHDSCVAAEFDFLAEKEPKARARRKYFILMMQMFYLGHLKMK
jgi:hypothetical protein